MVRQVYANTEASLRHFGLWDYLVGPHTNPAYSKETDRARYFIRSGQTGNLLKSLRKQGFIEGFTAVTLNHKPYPIAGFREAVERCSLQLIVHVDGLTRYDPPSPYGYHLEVDYDLANPAAGKRGLFLHGLEVLYNYFLKETTRQERILEILIERGIVK